MAYYNLTNITEATDISGFVIETSKLESSLMGMLFLIVIFFVSFIVLSARWTPKTAWMTSSFITMVLSYLLRTIGLISDAILIITLIVAGGAIALSFKE